MPSRVEGHAAHAAVVGAEGRVVLVQHAARPGRGSAVPFARSHCLDDALQVAGNQRLAVGVEGDVVDVAGRGPANSRSSLPSGTDQSLTRWSLPHVASVLPSGLTARARTQPLWASMVRAGAGVSASSGQTRMLAGPVAAEEQFLLRREGQGADPALVAGQRGLLAAWPGPSAGWCCPGPRRRRIGRTGRSGSRSAGWCASIPAPCRTWVGSILRRTVEVHASTSVMASALGSAIGIGRWST